MARPSGRGLTAIAAPQESDRAGQEAGDPGEEPPAGPRRGVQLRGQFQGLGGRPGELPLDVLVEPWSGGAHVEERLVDALQGLLQCSPRHSTLPSRESDRTKCEKSPRW